MRVVSIRTIGNLKLKRKKKDTRLVILEEFSLNRSSLATALEMLVGIC
jgi:hypothetical protein